MHRFDFHHFRHVFSISKASCELWVHHSFYYTDRNTIFDGLAADNFLFVSALAEGHFMYCFKGW